jgi:hypothetical protein
MKPGSAALAFAALQALAGCVTPQPVQIDAGCLTYGQQRRTMPPLTIDERSGWIAETDTAMTATCRKGR